MVAMGGAASPLLEEPLRLIGPLVCVYVFVFSCVFVFASLQPWGGASPLLEALLRLIGPFPKLPLCTHLMSSMIYRRKLSLQWWGWQGMTNPAQLLVCQEFYLIFSQTLQAEKWQLSRKNARTKFNCFISHCWLVPVQYNCSNFCVNLNVSHL